MGWGNCGLDSQGRPIGYAHADVCDHPDCKEKIHRGLSFACGDMHGKSDVSCEKYFCSTHKGNYVWHDGEYKHVCDSCTNELIDSGHWMESDEDGAIVEAY